MSDYGHELLFGSFLTPRSGSSEWVVELAVLSEQLGLDMVTFQDHPYQPAFLDTSTLLSFVAARTNSVRLAANVTNLPLRPPAVLARSLASLDLLSGGRIELGLGAGGFWDAIEAMGGARLSPGQAVQALEEAITVIRQIWDPETRGGVRVDGEFHRVMGAKRGPTPAHDMQIWLGAYKPRMLALVGRRADGWLPSLGYLEPGDLAAGNAAIDAAAEQAGRSVQSVRRLLNINGQFAAVGSGALKGPPEQWAEELADLALTDGISVFILGSDDPDDLRGFATEVAPAVRELVAAERRTPASGPADPGPTTTPPTVAARSMLMTPPAANARGPLTLVATPDDGRRRDAVPRWDESARPAGPVPDPESTYTAHDQAAGAQLIAVHNGLRAELAQIEELVEQVAAGTMDAGAARSDINTMTMRQNNWTVGAYCEAYCRVVTTHHILEDQALFPALRSADPRLTPVVDRLAMEHRVIHDVLEGVDRALVAFVSGPDGMSELRAAMDALSDTLLSHLAYEERELIEPLSRLDIF